MRTSDMSAIATGPGRQLVPALSRRRLLRGLRAVAMYDWNRVIIGFCAGMIAAAAWVANMGPADPLSARPAQQEFIVVPLAGEVR